MIFKTVKDLKTVIPDLFAFKTFSIGMTKGKDQSLSKPENHARPDLRRKQALQALIDHLEQNGVDVSRLKAAVQANDAAEIAGWFEESHQAHVQSLVGSRKRLEKPLPGISRKDEKRTGSSRHS